MALNTNNDPLMYKCFLISLAGPTLNWFKNLAQGSIASFQDLCDKFISQYYGNKCPTKNVSSLFTMKQHEDKQLQAFLTQFNLVKNMVMECHLSTAVQAFKLTMNQGIPFHTSLVVNTPKTMDELNERADGFVHLEEEEEAANSRKTLIILTKEKSKAKIRQKQAQPQRQTSWKTEKRSRDEELVTPLRVTLTREPKETSGDADRKGGIYRTTESEELLRTRLCQAQLKRIIGSVHALHQQNASAQIKFDRTDLLRVQVPHKDPLVVSLTVAECLARRVLIDPGSSANVIPRVTFDRLEIEPEKLKPTGNPLLGFDGK
ncbi:uncharacterized protein LOC132277045 [Cornus florida]|uniref:uncharacterized protein LOC132277045 n=1 Tax=Cornus florida TaxID=4283 RepID=UPI002899FCDB|nr:uncharacterized protein LOC132277045 [Cornus florida]